MRFDGLEEEALFFLFPMRFECFLTGLKVEARAFLGQGVDLDGLKREALFFWVSYLFRKFLMV